MDAAAAAAGIAFVAAAADFAFVAAATNECHSVFFSHRSKEPFCRLVFLLLPVSE